MNYMTFKAGGNEYRMVLTTRAMVELEKKIGCNPIDILLRAQDGTTLPKVSDMIAILWSGLLKFNHGIKLEDCYDIFDNYLADGHATIDFLGVMMELFQVSGIVAKEDASNPNGIEGK